MFLVLLGCLIILKLGQYSPTYVVIISMILVEIIFDEIDKIDWDLLIRARAIYALIIDCLVINFAKSVDIAFSLRMLVSQVE